MKNVFPLQILNSEISKIFSIYFHLLHSVFAFRFEPASSHDVVGIFVICCGAS